MTSRRPALALTGVTHLSDLYPNVKYKIAILQQAATPSLQLYDLGSGSLANASLHRGLPARIGFALRYLWGHMVVFSKALLNPATAAYLPYPAVPALLFYSLWPKHRRPHLVADAFISLYDTAVTDRALINKDHWLAGLLFTLEKRAYRTADVIVVDTQENGHYYAKLFALPVTRFVDLPLSLPPLQPLPPKPKRQTRFRCLFMGSMVPLQGVITILDAARLLRDYTNIEFVLIGTGQQAAQVEHVLQHEPLPQVTWIRELVTTEKLREEIGAADLCLGIFGTSDKADRVLPYKLYYYALLGKPFVTRRSATLERMAAEVLLCDNTAAALADRIRVLSMDATQLDTCTTASLDLGRTLGNKEMLLSKLKELLRLS